MDAKSVRSLPILEGLPAKRLELRPVASGAELADCAALEAASYPADEAASPERLAQRQRDAPAFFWAAFETGAVAASQPTEASVLGFICGTLAQGPSLTHESMSQHVPNGTLLCVHSVVVRKELRRKGLALAMLREYVRAIAVQGRALSCALLTKANILPLYVKAGFQLLGQSGVVHGTTPWFELRLEDVTRQGEDVVRVDAFTSKPCAGNPAAVVFTQRAGDADWMQRVAEENNLSETAFVEREAAADCEIEDAASRFALRWFTPGCEVDLCGHATLGAAHALWSTGRASKRRRIEFSTKASGTLTCRLGAEGWIQMDFPADPPSMSGALPSAAQLVLSGCHLRTFWPLAVAASISYVR